MENIKWRFPGNGYTADTGLDTADMETFKKDAISSLARELCQNSIDARDSKAEGPVKIVFHSFEIDANQIPGRDELIKQIEACQTTWAFHKKISGQLQSMHEQICKDKITCLRISDFNTTGLLGIQGGDKTPWHYLVHGSGISDKGETSGGSKGIGKFATFVSSHFNTVFYSTRTNEGEVGFEGICKLCSSVQEGTDEKTQGIGYFGAGDKNEPIFADFAIDPEFSRNKNEYGSDVYIIGFKSPSGWKKDVISKTLDSFMSAIVFDSLEVEVDDVVINKTTLKEVVFNDNYINSKMRKSIVSQYILLTDTEHRYEDTITIDGYGSAKLFMVEFSGDNEHLATNNCVMIRYPYMKIKEIAKVSTLPCSAMCIIGDNNLNKILRSVENPQHTDWEFKRIENEDQKLEIKAIYTELIDKIKIIIYDHLSASDNTTTDIEGAEEYFEANSGDVSEKQGQEMKVKETPTIVSKRPVKRINVAANIEAPGGDGAILDIGMSDGGDIETVHPIGANGGGGGHVNPGTEQGNGKKDDNGSVIVIPTELRGMLYKFFCVNKKERRYIITFVSDYTEKEVTLNLFSLDEGGNRYPVKIQYCFLNGLTISVENETGIKMAIKKGERIKLEMILDQKDWFSGEVKVYAYR